MAVDVIYQGVLVALLTLLAYFIGHAIELGYWSWSFTNSPYGMTMAFITLSFAEIFHSFNMRSQRKSLFSIKKQNGMLFFAALGSGVATILVCLVPFVSTKLFGFAIMDWWCYLIAVGLAFCVLPVVEIVKLMQRAVSKKK
jgi:Ca2+-transporting ATPase